VIRVPGPPRDASGAEARLLAALAARGLPHAAGGEPGVASEGTAWLISDGFGGDPLAAISRAGDGDRILMLSRLRAHPDAETASLRRLWDLEERARGTGLPVLTLRLGPMVGPKSPLWRRLATRPALPREGRMLLHPVAEEDVVETIARAIRGPGPWREWFEVAGPEIWSLAELTDLAAEHGADPDGHAAWEPPLDELVRHRLVEPGPWLARFGLAPGPLAERARSWGGARSAA
jgi:hypothetical protein